jgi:hypothetical protein
MSKTAGGVLDHTQQALITEKLKNETGYLVRFGMIDDDPLIPGKTNSSLEQSFYQLVYKILKYYHAQGTNLPMFHDVIIRGDDFVIRKQDYETLQTGESKEFTMFEKIFCFILYQYGRVDIIDLEDRCLDACYSIRGKVSPNRTKMKVQFYENKVKFEQCYTDELFQFFDAPVNVLSKANDGFMSKRMRYFLLADIYARILGFEYTYYHSLKLNNNLKTVAFDTTDFDETIPLSDPVTRAHKFISKAKRKWKKQNKEQKPVRKPTQDEIEYYQNELLLLQVVAGFKNELLLSETNNRIKQFNQQREEDEKRQQANKHAKANKKKAF